MRIAPLTCAIGAELHDVRLGDAVRDDGLFQEIYAALLKYKVLFLRDQTLDKLSRQEHMAFAQRLGPLETHPMVPSHPEAPGLVQIYKSPESPNDRYENSWHTDGTWREAPALGCVLRCIECPPVGGDTIWVNMAAAYANLPEEIKRKIDGLRARSGIEHSFGAVMEPEVRRRLAEQYPPAEHPVVRTHPETGEKVLNVCSFTTNFVNYHTPENVRFGLDKTPGASQLLNYLVSQASIPEYQVRFRWKPNSVAIWDNRCTQHYAVQDYWPAARKMERAAIIGGRID